MLQTMKNLTDMIQDYAEVEPPADFRTKVMAKIISEMQQSRAVRRRAYRPERRFSGWAPVFAFVAGAMTVLWINFLTHRSMTAHMLAQPETSVSVPFESYVLIRARSLRQIEQTLVKCSPTLLKRTDDKSFLVELPHEKFNDLIGALSARGELLKMQRGGVASGKGGLARVTVEVELRQ